MINAPAVIAKLL